jgi:endo-1,4-beta-xylanase
MMRALRLPLVLALLALPTLGHPTAAGPAGCEAAKLVAAGGAAARIVKCHAHAARAGVAVDPTCIETVNAKLAASFARAEASACPASGDAASVTSMLTTLGSELTTIAGGGPSRCDGRKLRAAGKRIQSSLKAQAAHAKAPERDGLATALAKVSLTFAKQVLAAEAADGCTAVGNATSIAARADAGSADVVDVVRGTLRALAAARGRTIGAAVRANVLAASTQAGYRATLLRQVGAVTAEYELMWGNMEPSQGTYVTAPIDTIVAFSQQHGLALTGAPLVWHLILPPWVNDAMSAAELQAAVDERIDGVVGAYAGAVTTWDVVNEAVVDYGAALRDSIFLRKLGPDYIRNAFLRARAADPTALLFYNDFLADGLNVKSDFIYAMVGSQLAQGTPIDGVSFQMHLGGGFGAPPTRAAIRENLARFAALGLVVRISEMDVQIHDVPGAAADQLARQRAIYHDVVAACLDVPACDTVSFWGISDKYTWVKDYLGLSDRPLPFDEFFQPKAAFFGVRDALLE